mmetsp:Transcript_24226/g.60688  ORF Transcript_24226/g.60688 Transcript_24226/m.60688 type:complete len:244 (+) Transcript_24226:323-1054(+)
MQESLATEHGRELLRDAFEKFLNRCAVANEGGAHRSTSRRNLAYSALNVVRDPINEEQLVLLLDLDHLVIDILCAHLATEHHRRGEVATVARIRSGHHVARVKHLLSELSHRKRLVAHGGARCERSVADEEKVQTRERDQVHGQFAKVRVKLTREAQAARDAAHHLRDQTVQITVARCIQLECAKANIVQSFVIDAEHLVRVLHQLVNTQGGVVRLNNRITDLRRRHHRKGAHHAIGIGFTNL